MTSKNILLVWDRMGDYHRARWRALETTFHKHKIFAADLLAHDSLYHWESTRHNPLYVSLTGQARHVLLWNRTKAFLKVLRDNQISAVGLAGYGRVEYIVFMLLTKITGRQVILFAESWYPSNAVVEWCKSALIRTCVHGFLVSGERAQRHFNSRLRIPSSRIRIGYSVVDNGHFYVERAGPSQSKKILLCTARFVKDKNLEGLIRAFLKSKLARSGWTLRMVGAGTLKHQLASMAIGHPIEVKDWVSYGNLPALYAEASVFILPSVFEPWGLVVNEAMAAGLPIIVSRQVGCYPDLLLDQHNGWSFDAHDMNEWVNVLNTVGETNSPALIAMGEASRQRIQDFAPARFATQFKSLLLKV